MSAWERALGGLEIEVTAKATRRRFTVEYKRKIVREADACKTPGAVGALLRREGLYSSHLTTWRGAGSGESWSGRRRSAPSGLRRWSNCKNKWRRCWERRWPARPRDGDGRPDRTTAGHRPHLRSPGAAPRDVLSSASARARRADAAAIASGPRRGGTRGRARAVAHAALRGPGTRRGLRHAARRGPVSVFRADDVSRPGRARRGAGAARAAPASPLCRPGAARPPAQRALELGHHQAPRAGQVDLFLPVRHARCLQPLCGRLDGGPSG